MKLVEVPLRRPVATVMLLVCLTVLGSVAIKFLQIGFMPQVAEPEIDIQVPFPGAHPLEALRQVVRPIEEEVASIPNVKQTFGFINPGFAVVEVQFDWGVDIALMEMEVREAVERVRPDLPSGVGHIQVQGDTDGPSAEVLGGRISAQRDLSESWELLDRRIRRPLERIRGVARVNLYGVDPQQLRVDLDLAALKRHGMSVEHLIERLNAANIDLDLGSVQGDLLRYGVRAMSRFRDVESVRELALNDRGLRLKDVAAVAIREPLLLRGRHLNRNFAIGFDVFKEPSANTVDTVARLQRRLEEIRSDPELQGINVLVWQNQAEEILGSLGGLRNAGIFGGLLAVGVLYFFLRRAVTTAIVAVAIPFSLLVTCGGMLLFGMEFNVLTMLGLMLGVGMLVDNAVVVIENIYRLQTKGIPPREAARQGVSQVALAVVAATATTIIVWSWLFVSEPNEMRIYIGQVALVICIAVVCSLVISVTFIPLAAARFSTKNAPKPGFLVRRIVPRYRRVLGWTLATRGHRVVTLVLLLLLAASAGIPIAMIEKTGEPKVQTRDLLLNYRIHDQSTKDVIEGYVNQVEDVLEAHKENLGYEDLYSWYSEENNFANTRVYLPRGENTEKRYKALEDSIQGLLPVIPGVDLEFGDHRGRSRGPRRGGFVRIALHGEDPEFLEELALQAEPGLGEIEHVEEVFGPSLVGSEELRIVIDPEKAQALDVPPQRVADTVGFAFRGQRLRRYHGDQGEIELIVGLPERAQPGVAALKDLPIPVGDGQTVSLGVLADVRTARTPPRIRRVDRKTTIRIALQFDDEATTTAEVRKDVEKVMNSFVFPDGYVWDWGQRFRNDDEALGIMLRGVVISLLVVVLLMAALFESFTQPLAILITLPLALFGAFWSLWLFGFVFEVLGFIGIIILIGVVVNNGIVMVDHVNALRREGLSRVEALSQGCGDRLRPVLMTVITTVVGLIPLAMSQFTVAGVYIQSMAVAMIGGLVSSTVFTLIGLPVWYATVEDLGAVLAGLLPRKSPAGRVRLPRGGVLVGDDPQLSKASSPGT